MIAVRGILGVFHVVPLDKGLMRRAADFHDPQSDPFPVDGNRRRPAVVFRLGNIVE